MLGDNRDNTNDSRVWGTVPADLVIGKVTNVWWSSAADGTRWDRINQPVQ